MFKLIFLSQIGANRYKNIILEILLLSPPPPWRAVQELKNLQKLALGKKTLPPGLPRAYLCKTNISQSIYRYQ